MKRILVLIILFVVLVQISNAQRRIETLGRIPKDGSSQFSSLSITGDGIVFPELSLGTFQRDRDPSFFGSASLGLRLPISRFALKGTFGCAGIYNVPRTLGTNFEFKSTLGANWAFNNLDINLEFIHFSNARKVFGFRGPNSGEDFLVFGLKWTP